MWPNPQFLADLVTFIEEILNEKLHFLCSVWFIFLYILSEYGDLLCNSPYSVQLREKDCTRKKPQIWIIFAQRPGSFLWFRRSFPWCSMIKSFCLNINNKYLFFLLTSIFSGAYRRGVDGCSQPPFRKKCPFWKKKIK